MKKFGKKSISEGLIIATDGGKFLKTGNRKIFLGDEKSTTPDWYIEEGAEDGFVAFLIDHSAVVISGGETPQALRVIFDSGIVLTVTEIWKMKRGYLVKPLGHAPLQLLNSGGYVLQTLGTYPDYHVLDAEDEYVLARKNNSSRGLILLNSKGDEITLSSGKSYWGGKITLPVISAYLDSVGSTDIYLPDGTLLKENANVK